MATGPTPTVRLRNGADEAKPFVALIYDKMRRLLDAGEAGALYGLIKLCQEPDFGLFLTTGDQLAALGLVQRDEDSWCVDASIRNIVLSAVRDDSADMTIGSPLASSVPAPTEPSIALEA